MICFIFTFKLDYLDKEQIQFSNKNPTPYVFQRVFQAFQDTYTNRWDHQMS